MHKIVLKIHEYLEAAADGNIKVDEKLLDEFGDRVKAKLRKQLEEQGKKEFKLRMSNIGRPLRQLMLEKKYGRSKPDPEFMLKMLFGDLYEALMVYLLKASGVKVTELDTKVSLPVKTAKGVINVEGELDVVIEVNGKEYVYDIKSASPYSFNNKFDAAATLANDDPFGYIDQLFGYAAAGKKKAGGWIPINKSDGQIKVTEIPEDSHDDLMSKSTQSIEQKVRHIVEDKPMPECTGVVEEKFFQKLTGNKILGASCKFCSCKEKCHPGIQYKQAVMSKAKEPKYEWYVELNNKGNQSD